MGAKKASRIDYAREILQKELLPHTGLGEFTETKKAYFVGYMVHRWVGGVGVQGGGPALWACWLVSVCTALWTLEPGALA